MAILRKASGGFAVRKGLTKVIAKHWSVAHPPEA
jgi:hypothetical protein